MALLEGGIRLDRDTEAALNLLLLREGGNHLGAQLYKIGWAAEDNSRLVVPICFTDNPMSYHILAWEPPSMALALFETQLKEDTSRGTYNCITHFIDENGHPFAPTGFIIERMIPILRRAHDTAIAALRGERAIVERNRAKRKEQLLAEEKGKERDYDRYVESVLADTHSEVAEKKLENISLADLRSAPNADQPKQFDFTLRRAAHE